MTETGPAGPILVLRIAGDIDTLTRPAVHTALTAALAQTPGDLVIDLSGVGFCCVRGLELLVDNGPRLVGENPSPLTILTDGGTPDSEPPPLLASAEQQKRSGR